MQISDGGDWKQLPAYEPEDLKNVSSIDLMYDESIPGFIMAKQASDRGSVVSLRLNKDSPKYKFKISLNAVPDLVPGRTETVRMHLVSQE